MYFHFEKRFRTVELMRQKRMIEDSAAFALDSSRTDLGHWLQLKIKVPQGRLLSLWSDSILMASGAIDGKTITLKPLELHGGANRFKLYVSDYRGRSTLMDSFTINFSSERLRYLSRPLTRLPVKSKVLALTFDGGSLNKGTEHILQILRTADIRCAIFLTGHFIKTYPQMVKEIVRDGREVGNHSLTHPHLTLLEIDGSSQERAYVNRKFILRQLQTTASLFLMFAGSTWLHCGGLLTAKRTGIFYDGLQKRASAMRFGPIIATPGVGWRILFPNGTAPIGKLHGIF